MSPDQTKPYEQLYTAPEDTPIFVDVPEQKIISISGKGDPNSTAAYGETAEALFPVAAAIQAACQKLGHGFTVMPFEGFLWTDDMGIFSILNKNLWKWETFIVQPDFVTAEIFAAALEEAEKNTHLPLLKRIEFKTIHEGRCVQIMRLGPPNKMAPTVAKLRDFVEASNLRPVGKHHIIYLNDKRKVAPEDLKTIIRQPIA